MGQFTLSSYSSNTMARIFVVSLLVALSHAAPSAPVAVSAPLAYGHLGHLGHLGHAHIAAPAVVGTQVQEHVGHRTVQVGSQAVQVGHTYAQEKSVSQAPAYTYVAGPPAPTNQGPAPADTVTVTKIAAPVRTHTRITPQVTRIEPEIQVNKCEVEVPVAVPVPVEREVIVEKHVAKPYTVEVPQPYAVPKPYKVHPVQHVVETPVIDQHHVTVHQPAVHAVAAPVAYAHAPAVAAPAVAYAGHAVAAPAVGYAGHPVAYAGHLAAPVAVAAKA